MNVSASQPDGTYAALYSPQSHERKYNVVVNGIQEYPRGTPKASQLRGNIDKAISVLSGLESSIGIQSVKDIFHLGKFSTDC